VTTCLHGWQHGSILNTAVALFLMLPWVLALILALALLVCNIASLVISYTISLSNLTAVTCYTVSIATLLDGAVISISSIGTFHRFRTWNTAALDLDKLDLLYRSRQT